MRNSRSPNLPDLNVTGAWKLGYTGRGSVVTFLDDGLEYDHPDLKENYVRLFQNLITQNNLIIFYCLNRIKMPALISMEMTMIQRLFMIHRMKISTKLIF